MRFLNRVAELAALESAGTGLAVVWGRRRIGKTRLLVEWCERTGGVYTVADQSSAELQRAYFARALGGVLPGFGDVAYPDWDRLLTRLATDAAARKFRGPIVIDELPYLVATSPELPSILQRWIDHDAKRAGLAVAVAGSSQRMMQGLVLAADAPLYGRAKVLLDVQPLAPAHLKDAFGRLSPTAVVEHWTAWGGVPRYWELAQSVAGDVRDRIVHLALDPVGPLFTEPDRLLLEELPPSPELRPLLDAIGAGAHRLTEIAARTGRAATSLGHAIERLIAMGFVRRETPYGEPARGGKRSLYKIADPFLRMWFGVVAPDRATLIAGTRASRRSMLDAHWALLVGQAWEELCSRAVPALGSEVGGPWQPPRRYWHGNAPEWDLVADAIAGNRTLLGEAWFAQKPVAATTLRREAQRLEAKPPPPMLVGRELVRVLFVPSVQRGAPKRVGSVHVVTTLDVVRRRRG